MSPAPAQEEALAAGHQPTVEQRPSSSLHPSVAAEAVERMERIVAAREDSFPWVRVAWEAIIVVPFDETLDAPCGGSGHGCMIHGIGGPAEVWISLDTIRDEPPSDFDLLWGSPKRSLERVLLHELAHVLDLTAAGDAIDRGDAFRAATQGFRDYYAGCRFGRFDTERSVHELLAETVAALAAGHSFGRWTELDGCLATLPPPDEHIDNLGFALAGCGSVGSLDDLGRDRTAMWCPDEFAELEAADALIAAQREDEALAVKCRDDMDTSWLTGASGPPGWERGCKEAGHIPDEVPCVVLLNGQHWKPGYFDEKAECAENTALYDRWSDAARAWLDCLPDDGGRWQGDWTANPANGRPPCPDTPGARALAEAEGDKWRGKTEAERLAEAEAEAERLAAEAAAAAKRALFVACSDDLGVYGGPGWEQGCKDAGHIPDEVPCVVSGSRGWLPGYFDDRDDWLPEYFNGDGQCRVNVGLTSAPRAWLDCLPDEAGRWQGDWTASPLNGRWPCSATLAAECANDVNRSPRLPQMHWGDTDGNSWPPGWEEGCREAGLIPDEVPCVVSTHDEAQRDIMVRHGFLGMRGSLPGQPDGRGGCTANMALFRADNPQTGLRDWLACLPGEDGRWTGDWTANPDNGRDPCPAG